MRVPAATHRARCGRVVRCFAFVCSLAGATSAHAAGYPQDAATMARGRLLFTQLCASCHTLSQDGIGPPLGGITTILPAARLEDWIRDPAKVIAAGEPRAVALSRRYKTVMPPFGMLDDRRLAAILAYLDGETSRQHLAPFAVDTTAAAAGPARLLPPIQPSDLAVELEDFVQIPRLPGRTPYKGITLLRPDPREEGALLVDDLMGILYRVTRERRVSVFLDVRGFFPEFICDPGVATGLGSFALHPDFAHNGIFYTSHAERYRGSPSINAADIPADVPPYDSPRLEWVLTEWHLADPTATAFAGTHREVLRFVTPTTGHAWQEIAFAPVTGLRDPDYGLLYIGCGDGGSTNLKRPDMSGHLHTLLGSILRIDPAGHNGANGHYGIPADNPYARDPDPAVRREIWADGFRNPHRMSWDLAHDRRMIAVDIGESNVEEVNLIHPGGAYGYGARQLEGTFHLDPRVDAKVVRPATPAELAGTLPPFAAYDHLDGAAITGGFVYHGPLAALQEKYVFGDIVNGKLLYLTMGAELTDHTIHQLNVVRDGRITSLMELAHLDRAHLRLGYDARTGDLYVLTKPDGMIRRISAVHELPHPAGQ